MGYSFCDNFRKRTLILTIFFTVTTRKKIGAYIKGLMMMTMMMLLTMTRPINWNYRATTFDDTSLFVCCPKESKNWTFWNKANKDICPLHERWLLRSNGWKRAHWISCIYMKNPASKTQILLTHFPIYIALLYTIRYNLGLRYDTKMLNVGLRSIAPVYRPSHRQQHHHRHHH